MATSTVENYIKQIYLEEQRHEGHPVPMGKLAAALKVFPGTATTMIKSLAEANLVAYESRVGVRLTGSGEKLALHVLRRHRVIELFLVKVLDMNWSEVHEEAENMEHALSDEVLARMEKFLGYPTVDPHGDPIPSPKGELDERELVKLTECSPGSELRIGRVLDQEGKFLRFLEKNGLELGVTVKLLEMDPVGQTVSMSVEGAGKTATLSLGVAEKIEAELLGEEKSQKDEG